MSYNRHNLAVAKFASKSTIRPEMSCVAFYGNRTLATDSFRLVEVSADGEAHDISLRYAHDVKARKVGKYERIELDGLQAFDVTPMLGDRYPDVTQVMKSQFENSDEYVTVKVNGAYLAEIAKTLADMSYCGQVTMQVPIENERCARAVRLFAEAKTGKREQVTQTARALLMPINDA